MNATKKMTRTYTRGELAELIGIRSDGFKKNLQRGLYNHLIGEVERNAKGHRIFSEDQAQRLLGWYSRSEVPKLRIIAMGGGIQTTCMLLMHLHGEWHPEPDATMFCDLGWESQATYWNIAWLKIFAESKGFPFHWLDVTSLSDELIEAAEDRSHRIYTPPLFIATEKEIEGKDGILRIKPGKGQITRECTSHYKIEAMARAIRRELGVPGRQLIRHRVEVWLGITTDEAQRMNNNSPYPWITNVFPLIDRGMSRKDCEDWLTNHGYGIPPKSACLGCPYRPNHEWRKMRDEEPAEFAQVVQIDNAIRSGLHKFTAPMFIHQSCTPLAEGIAKGETKEGWGNECGGVCAV